MESGEIAAQHDLIFVLGAPNDQNGELSEIARKRVETAVDVFRRSAARNRSSKIVLTGGFGEHFNTTATPHWVYARDYMGELGVPADAIDEAGLESANSVEDAVMILDYLEDHSAVDVFVVTSEIHVERCALIFACMGPNREFQFVGAPNAQDGIQEAVRHEKAAIERLKRQGGVIFSDRLFPLPSE